jgi:endonuclease/exonuclease/phosphatase family metal-dependent hydrolase
MGRAAVVIALALVSSAAPAFGRTLRVLSYNIHHSEGRDGVFDLNRIAGVINAANADVIALQELDQGNNRSGLDEFQLNELAQLTGRQGFFGKTINYMGGEYGNGVLIHPDLLVTRTINHPLPNPANREGRAVLEVRVSVDGDTNVDFNVCATHLDANSDDTNKFAQAAFINDLVDNSTTPALLAGDMNARASSRTFDRLTEQWTDATNIANPGNPVVTRTNQIDYIMYRRPQQWTVVERGRFIINTTTAVASDHYPILSVLELRSPVADFDGDGVVTGSDFLIWQRNVGSGSTLAQGDANGDQTVNALDLNMWKEQFGPKVDANAAAFAVPEATSVLLMSLVISTCTMVRRGSQARCLRTSEKSRSPCSLSLLR